MVVDWSKVKHFQHQEFFHDHEKINPLLIYALDELRTFVDKPIHIHSAYRRGDKGTHGCGDAADIHIEGLSVLQQFLMAERTRLFSGIGVYPFWNNPGLHLDVRMLRPQQHGPRWGRNAAGVYVALDDKFIRSIP